jgi:hypothetical protein
VIENVALKCIEDIKAKVKTAPLLNEKVFFVATEENLAEELKLRAAPLAGVMYEGIRSSRIDQQGKSSELGVAIVVVAQNNVILNLDRKEVLIQILDQTRNAIMGKQSPTGHAWRFMNEIPIADMGPNMLYMQRWTSALIV